MPSESQHLEFKRELIDTLEREVVGFLNSREGGRILIGVDDAGSIVGLADPDGDQLKIKDRLKQNIQPSCLGLFDVLVEENEGSPWIKLLVASGSEKPYYLRKHGMSPRGCFLRIGSATEPMTERQIEALFAKRTRNSISRIVSPRQDLKFSQLKIYYEATGREPNAQFLKNLELFTEDERYNYAAYLLADINNTSIKVAKYAGKDRVDLIENEEERTDYTSLLKEHMVRPSKLEIWLMDANGNNKQQITTLKSASFAPFLHPNGKQIIFCSNSGDPKGREFDLFLINTDGSMLERVTTTPDFDGFPMFSRDGKKVVFASNRYGSVPGETNIFVADWKD